MTGLVRDAVDIGKSRSDVEVAEAYRITTVAFPVGEPPEVNTRTVPPQDLHAYFNDYAQLMSIVVDVRPVETAAAEVADE